MIRAPGIVPHTETALVTNEDITATIVEFAGTSMGTVNGHQPDGMSLVRLLEDPETQWRSAILLELVVSRDGKPPAWSAVRTPHWKYVELATGEKELYNMISDPFELRNVAENPAKAGIVATLKAQLEELKSQ
jgi:arylsulfatase A-like enzyme